MTYLTRMRLSSFEQLASSPARLVLCAVMLVLASLVIILRVWVHGPYWGQQIALWTGVTIFLICYLRYGPQLLERDPRPRFSTRQVLLVTTAVALMGAVGYGLDAIVLLSLLIYAYLMGPTCKRLARHLVKSSVRSEYVAARWASAIILMSGAALVTATAMAMVFGAPSDSGSFPAAVALTLYPSVLFAWAFILGDNAQSSTQLLLYGLPFGIPFILVTAGAAGYLMGLVGLTCFRRRPVPPAK